MGQGRLWKGGAMCWALSLTPVLGCAAKEKEGTRNGVSNWTGEAEEASSTREKRSGFLQRCHRDCVSAGNGMRGGKTRNRAGCPSHWIQRYSCAEQTTGFQEAVRKFLWMKQKKEEQPTQQTNPSSVFTSHWFKLAWLLFVLRPHHHSCHSLKYLRKGRI